MSKKLSLTKKTGEGLSLPSLGGMEEHSLSPKYGKLAAAVTPTSGAEVNCSGPSSVGHRTNVYTLHERQRLELPLEHHERRRGGVPLHAERYAIARRAHAARAERDQRQRLARREPAERRRAREFPR